ncbi:hypothetical protein VIGAN_01374400 [Vigna angularis var. angularis]|uniref:Uncharacterized protein n=1 Tax=Vigna angularis var. angularis TaxID=157739 RepID=A0A0S3R5Q1_PHAAN|nr:hypothetical protein VIGAN_01374400 [Vigna angularis var. angularis]
MASSSPNYSTSPVTILHHEKETDRSHAPGTDQRCIPPPKKARMHDDAVPKDTYQKPCSSNPVTSASEPNHGRACRKTTQLPRYLHLHRQPHKATS